MNTPCPLQRCPRILTSLALALLLGGLPAPALAAALTDTNQPAQPLRLFFIHHSTGQNWLSDDYGRLGLALRDQGYYVSDSNYGWGPNGIGDHTDLGHWYEWFRGPDSATYLAAAAAASGQNCDYSRLATAPGGANRILMFKSCYPNSALEGNPGDPVPAIASNPLRGQDVYSGHHTVANAKGIYRDLLECFAAHTNTLFVAITAPPLSDSTWSGNARAFNNWLVDEWLDGYPHANVFVFDFYNVLTSNGGSSGVTDVGLATGNHHRYWEGAVQHQTDGGGNTLAYPSGDDHPNAVGSRKATAEFVPLLNAAANAWLASLQGTPNAPSFLDLHVTPSTVELAIADLSPGFTYALQRSPSLAPGSWADLTTLTGVTATNWTDTTPIPSGPAFYRLESR